MDFTFFFVLAVLRDLLLRDHFAIVVLLLRCWLFNVFDAFNFPLDLLMVRLPVFLTFAIDEVLELIGLTICGRLSFLNITALFFALLSDVLLINRVWAS